jgi:hypothetical protein
LRLAHLAPSSILTETIGDQMTHLCLANRILEDRRYMEFYYFQARRGAHVIMDTPAFERIDISLDDLLDAVHAIQPSQVILPDDMDDPDRSIRRMERAATRLWDKHYGLDLMAVPHGKTVEGWRMNALACAQLRGVTTLGIQEEVEEEFHISRPEFVKLVHQWFPHMRLHFNGFTDDMLELEDQTCQTLVGTADSAKLVVYGLNGLEPMPALDGDFPEYPGRKSLAPTSMEYFDWIPPEDFGGLGVSAVSALDARLVSVRNNIRRWNAMANNGMVVS